MLLALSRTPPHTLLLCPHCHWLFSPSHPRLSLRDLLQLRRALSERGIDKLEWMDKPDELKLLRALAKESPSVCEGAIGKSRKKEKKH